MVMMMMLFHMYDIGYVSYYDIGYVSYYDYISYALNFPTLRPLSCDAPMKPFLLNMVVIII